VQGTTEIALGDVTAPPPSASDATTPSASPSPAAPRVIDERIAFIMHTMLQDVIRHGTAVRAQSLKRNDLAGKTGTTNEADTWFNGYQKNLVATVWVGFSDHRPVGDNEYGSNAPLPIWIDFMNVALQGVPEEVRLQPPGVVSLKIDPRTGDPAPPDQQSGVFEYFLAEHTPNAQSSGAAETEPGGEQTIKPVDLF
jgi:penicillin-binding protein 1A